MLLPWQTFLVLISFYRWSFRNSNPQVYSSTVCHIKLFHIVSSGCVIGGFLLNERDFPIDIRWLVKRKHAHEGHCVCSLVGFFFNCFAGCWRNRGSTAYGTSIDESFYPSALMKTLDCCHSKLTFTVNEFILLHSVANVLIGNEKKQVFVFIRAWEGLTHEWALGTTVTEASSSSC